MNELRLIQNAAAQSPRRKQYGFRLREPLVFRSHQGQPLRLAVAFDQIKLKETLLYCDMPVLKTDAAKYTIVVHTHGQNKFRKQKWAMNTKRTPLTMGKVARHVAEVVTDLIEESERQYPGEDDSCRLGPGYIDFEDIYLCELRQITKASYLAILARRSPVA
ncbi:hypothetical protein BC835DRAFT_1415750 [Cytidiella melzeri]|nr:hypothetical protein BC835DRAFT_1415750 [Cytidiella melzeri]